MLSSLRLRLAVALLALVLVALGWRELESAASPWRPALAAALLTGLVLGMSRLAGWLAGWEYLATATEFPRLAYLARQWGVELPPLAKWSCGPRSCGIFVLGFVPGCRSFVVTDGLWNRLDAAKIEALLAHELAHLRRRHPLLRLWVLLAPLGVWLAAARVAPDLVPHPATGHTADGAAAVGVQLFVWATWLAYTRWAFGRVAQLLEREADLDASQGWLSLGDAANPPGQPADGYAVALAALGQASGRPLDEWTWQHGRLSDRLASLAAEPHLRPGLRPRVRWISSLSLGVLAGGLASEFWGNWGLGGPGTAWLDGLF